jgi:osmotically-inducible protein OsmY
MKTDTALQLDVQKSILWEPLLDGAEIGVTVKDGVVTLSGYVGQLCEKTRRQLIRGIKKERLDALLGIRPEFAM